ncbi:Ig-like domain-containing protein [Anaeromicropila populeti]|uniref:Ig-like domain-containing protein n=1 Tax=Anaeromicropila populeti TaxID=37658 RepID=A0A1I6I5Q4_9FIRM|nr:Ig-like domain-containing protein [Anaeromicropila populeti]SFR61964.1 Ig-like domain-containing protein [Anaeromicropila populeti]
MNSSRYLNIESVTPGMEEKVKQNIRFRTPNFIWRVKFNTPLDPATVNNQNLYVTTLNKTPLKTSIRYNTTTNEIEVEPLEHYSENESYLLNVTTKVKSKGGQTLKKPIQIQFKI